MARTTRSLRVALVLLAVELGCGGGPNAPPPASLRSSPSPTLAGAEALYSASARDYGFDFDARVWEIDRLPQSSLVRSCSHPAGMSVKSWFAIGCKGELARLRGYRYSWQLRTDAVPCRLDPSQEDRDVLLAFTKEKSTYELPRNMLRAWIGPGVFQWSSEAAGSIELARQQLGHWPDDSGD